MVKKGIPLQFRERCILCGNLRKVWPGGLFICDHCDNVWVCCYNMHFCSSRGVMERLGHDGWEDQPWGNLSDIVPMSPE